VSGGCSSSFFAVSFFLELARKKGDILNDINTIKEVLIIKQLKYKEESCFGL